MRVFIGVGSNISADNNIIKALDLLKNRISIIASSTFYETAPALGKKQANYINGVLAAETDLGPRRLRKILRRIEKKLGRRRGRQVDSYASRPIDLDILLYGRRVINAKRIDIPDKHILDRAFISHPLAELEPELVMPGNNRRVSEIAAATDGSGMTALLGISEEIRRFISHE